MSDDAIHDILEQTESDPAFQALFDLFDYSNYYLVCFYFVYCAEFFLIYHSSLQITMFDGTIEQFLICVLR